jgi:hypothetical protein
LASLPTGHAPQLSAPETLAKALIPFLKGAHASGAEDPLLSNRSLT